jgi:predicted Zn-dependent protease
MTFPRFVRSLSLFLSVLALSTLAAQPVAAQAILRDAETEAVFREMTKPIIIAAGLDPRNVEIIIIHDKEINAFVAGGQVVFIHSGLITAADNANQVQGVVAHELGHMAGGHVIFADRGARGSYGIMLVSLLLGAAAMAAGGGEAAAGILGAGQQAALGKYLAFSRTQEATADAAGVKYLESAHISGRGSIDFFKKLQNQEYRFYQSHSDEQSYNQTHPLTNDRITFLADEYPKSSAWNNKTDPALEAKFQRVKAKLAGFVNDPDQTLRDYPESNHSLPAHYARAYAYHRGAYPVKAQAEADALLAAAPHDPYFLELKGQILLESGKPKEALVPLREAVRITEAQPLITATFGHALVETEDRTNYPEALRWLRAAVNKDRENPDAWYSLGVIYDRTGDVPRAALCTAESAQMEQKWPVALRNAQIAYAGLPKGSPDSLRAQDIELIAKNEVEKIKKKKH